jgi:hypothetical protein
MLPQEIEALAKCLAPMVAEQVIAKLSLPPTLSSPEAAPAVRQMLTVEQFAFCLNRSQEFVRRKIRGRVIPANFISGPPYQLHPSALKGFGVTPEIAAQRLKEWTARPVQTPHEELQRSQA